MEWWQYDRQFYTTTAAESGGGATVANQGWRNRGGGGGADPSGPQEFHLLEGTEGDPIFYQMGLFTDIVLFCRQFAIFTYTL